MDLVQEFVDATDLLGPSEPFRRWAGMVLTSCLLGRHVKTSIKNGLPLYPNLFVIFSASSGIGKSSLLDTMRDVLDPWTQGRNPRVMLCEFEVSTQYILRRCSKAFPAQEPRSSCFAVIADEGIQFFGERIDIGKIGTLTTLWDNKNRLDRGTITGEREGDLPSVHQPYMVGAWGAQPEWFTLAMRPEVFKLGLPARTIFVVSDEPPGQMRISRTKNDFLTRIKQRVEPTMVEVMAQADGADGKGGFYEWTDAAWAEFDRWANAGGPRRVADTTDPWTGDLRQYGRRRNQHLGKMALVLACARHPDARQIALDDFADAREMLWDVEEALPDLVARVGANPDLPVEDEVVAWVRAQGEVAETDVRARLRLRAKGSWAVKAMIEELVASGQLVDLTRGNNPPLRRFKAKGVRATP